MLFPEDMTLEEKQNHLQQTAELHNLVFKLSPSTACASSFSLVKDLLADQEIMLALYYIGLCDDIGDRSNKDDLPD